ncbi:MAG: DUF4197 domain-containing protein [Burkholderiaceae bacterium]|nr:DUF4197 domain-containing protein [Burkholderiaceae bacterium]MDH3459562.1 DUF4197 domain-containing protein [Burkholderiaceae bacterium]
MLKRQLYVFFASLALAATQAHAFDLGGLLNKEKVDTLKESDTAAPATTTPAATPDTSGGSALNLATFSSQDQVGSLKQALAQGAETAVANLAKENGYLGNDKVRIPLPASLQKVEGMMRKFGMGKYADDLVNSMNRAAEAAVPEAKALLIGAVQNMTVDDATSILTGSNDAATQYFRKNTETALSGKFKPIVTTSMQRVKVAEKYDQFSGKGVKFGLVDERDAKLDDYITRKAMDGLFLMMAEQEKAIRANPLQATGDLAKKIFSALKF